MFNGKKWTLLFSKPNGQFAYFESKVLVVSLSGFIISLLLFSLALSLLDTRYRVKQINKITVLYDDIAGQKSISIKNILPDKAPVFADNAMINTILRNLISNAVKFTMPGGKIIVSAMEKQNEIICSVSDNGLGIPKNNIEKLFRIDQSYSTAGTNEETGTGLGLILCKEFVEKHNGKIWVDSEEQKGSTFYFTLPYNAELQEKNQ